MSPGDRASPDPTSQPVAAERRRAVDAMLRAALERPPAERSAFLARACGSDAALHHEVASMLAHTVADDFLEPPSSGVPRASPGGSLPNVGDEAPPSRVASGERLTRALAGRYAVEHELGRGGMATVYLARDLRHRRQVAIKVLREHLSASLGPERFLHEIAVTASLQHPHILPLFDSGAAAGLLYYVMPFIDGETLRARLTRERQLPIDDALRIAGAVASALTHAHEHGVIHRDVKPENVLLQGGHALVADFGIALAVEQASGTRLTQTGMVLGTPQYMAPEQATGERAADARTDVYALGAVLYEMLTGEPPFTGPTAQAIVARAQTEEPRSVSAARPSVPRHVAAAVRTALSRIPADRFASAHEFSRALADPTFGAGGAPPRADRGRTRAVGLAAGALLAGVAAWTLLSTRAPDGGPPATAAATRGPVRFTIELDSSALRFGTPAISPDGRTVVYAGLGLDGSRLFARGIDQYAARALPGTEQADLPFFSPDGEWVGFYSDGAIRKVRLSGGSPERVAQVPRPQTFAGGSWGEDGQIVFTGTARGAVYRVSAVGGGTSRVPVRDSALILLHPHLLPGGRMALVTATYDYTAGRVAVLDLTTGRVRQFGPGAGARFVAGDIVYVGLGGELFRQRFDLRRLEPSGPAEQIGSGLDAFTVSQSVAATSFDASPTGTLIYRVGSSRSREGNLRLILTDRTGRELRSIPTRVPWAPRFSPDGARIAYGAFAPGRDSSDVWITDLRTGATVRLTDDARDNNDPQWSPDGASIAYSADTAGGKDLVIRPLDGAPARRLARPEVQWPSDWTAREPALLFTEVRRAGGMDIWVQPLDGGAARPFVATPARELGGRVSPDGRWVAYTSDETGRDEVYVQSYPTPGRKTLASTGGGANPVWGPGGRELYYWRIDQLVAVHVRADEPGVPVEVRDHTVLFRAPYFENVHAMYDVSPDGQRFILVTGGARAGRLVVELDALGDGRTRERGAIGPGSAP